VVLLYHKKTKPKATLWITFGQADQRYNLFKFAGYRANSNDHLAFFITNATASIKFSFAPSAINP